MCIIFLCVLGWISVCITSRRNSTNLLDSIETLRGTTRVISKEEVEFYRYFVERDLVSNVSEEEIQRKTKEYTEYVNAVFYLGNKWDLSEPYSFELLEFRMLQENQQRKAKIEQGEVVYGLQQFTLETYFQYLLGNLETKLHQYLENNIDKDIVRQAKDYYQKNKEKFKYRKEVTYELTSDNKVETVSVDDSQLNFLGKTDERLADFLSLEEIGACYQDIVDGESRTIVIKDIIFNEDIFEKNQEIVVYKYIREELLDKIIEKIILNNPIEYEKN